MRKQLVLIIPILAAMIGMFAIIGLSSVNAQNMSTPETNMTSMSNATMGGNMTGSENMTNSSSPMMIIAHRKTFHSFISFSSSIIIYVIQTNLTQNWYGEY